MVRDFTVLAYDAYSEAFPEPFSFADPLAGVGARSIRVALECKKSGHLFVNDVNPLAMEAARLASQRNGVHGKMSFHAEEAGLFLAELSGRRERVDIVDIDPFGTPAPYVEPALRALKDGGLLSVTATDTAILCGIHPQVAFRKYLGMPLRSEYCVEVGLRLLLAMVVRKGLAFDMAPRPLFAHADQHYMRVYCSFELSASKANLAVGHLGYVLHCFKCGHREASPSAKERCGRCGGTMQAAGPLWTSDLHDSYFLKRMSASAREGPFLRFLTILDRASSEVGLPPYFFKLPKLTAALKSPGHSPSKVVEELSKIGYRAAVSSVDPQGIKTDASIEEIIAILKASNP